MMHLNTIYLLVSLSIVYHAIALQSRKRQLTQYRFYDTVIAEINTSPGLLPRGRSLATTGGHRKMARTPLLRALQRLASEHAEASARGIPVEEVRRLRRAEISRRDFLKGAGAVAAGLTLSGTLAGRELIAHAAAPPRIAIIGGGISGLMAALTLGGGGYGSTFLQASARLGGGRHSRYMSWGTGETSEAAGELI